MKYMVLCMLMVLNPAWGQSPCVPFSPENTKVVDAGFLKTVEGALSEFDPCHRSVQLGMPSAFTKKTLR